MRKFCIVKKITKWKVQYKKFSENFLHKLERNQVYLEKLLRTPIPTSTFIILWSLIIDKNQKILFWIHVKDVRSLAMKPGYSDTMSKVSSNPCARKLLHRKEWKKQGCQNQNLKPCWSFLFFLTLMASWWQNEFQRVKL